MQNQVTLLKSEVKPSLFLLLLKAATTPGYCCCAFFSPSFLQEYGTRTSGPAAEQHTPICEFTLSSLHFSSIRPLHVRFTHPHWCRSGAARDGGKRREETKNHQQQRASPFFLHFFFSLPTPQKKRKNRIAVYKEISKLCCSSA